MTYLAIYLFIGFVYAAVAKNLNDNLFWEMGVSEMIATAVLWPYFVVRNFI